MNLALHKHGIKLAPAVINRHIAFDLCLAGIPVNLDHADMRAKGEDTRLWFPEDGRLQARFDTRGQRIGEISRQRDIAKGDRLLWRASNREFAIFQGHIRSTGLQHMGCNLLHLLLQPLDSSENGRTTNCRGAAPIGAASLWRRIGIAMHNQDILYWDAKFLRDDLGKGRLFSLTVRRRAGIDHDSATLLGSHTRTLVETNRCGPLGAKPADLNVGGDTNAHQLAIGPFPSLFRT